MKRLLKFLGYSVATVLVLVLSSYLIFQFSSDERRKEWTIWLVQVLSERELSINGDFQLEIGSELLLVAGDVALANADWGTAPVLFRADKIESRLDTWSVLKGVLDFDLDLLAPELFLETAAQGAANWKLGEEAPADQHPGNGFSRFRGSINLSQGAFEYRNNQSGKTDHAGINSAKIHFQQENFGLQLDGHFNEFPLNLESELGVSTGGAVGTRPLTFQGVLGPLSWKANGSITGQSNTNGDWWRLSLKDLTAELQDGVSMARVTGQIDDLADLGGTELAVALQAPSLADLSRYLPAGLPQLPPLGAVEATGRLQGNGAVFGLSGIRAQVYNKEQNLSLTGNIGDLLALKDVDLNLEGSVQNLSKSVSGLPAELSNLGPVKIQATLQEKRERSGELVLAGSLTGEQFSISGSGLFKSPDSEHGILVDAELRAASLADLGRLLGIKLPAAGPLAARATLGRTGSKFILDAIDVKLGKSDLSGRLSFVSSPSDKKSPGTIEGRLASRLLDFTELSPPENRVQLQVVDYKDGKPEDTASQPSSGEKLFSPVPLRLKGLLSRQVNLELAVEKAKGRHFDWENLQTSIRVDKGILAVDPFQAQTDGKPVEFKLVVDGAQVPSRITLDYDADAVDIGRVTTKLGTFLQGGEVNLHVHVNGIGNSLQAIMASLNGTVALGLKNSQITNEAANQLGESLFDRLDPQGYHKGESVPLECAAIFYAIKDGIATTPRGTVAKFPKVTWIGNGEIDLRTEKILFSYKPRASEGLGISLNQLANLVLLGGTLKQPILQLDPIGVVGASAAYAAAISTGGLSLLITSMLDRSQANEAVCERVLEQIVEGSGAESDGATLVVEKPKGVLEELDDH